MEKDCKKYISLFNLYIDNEIGLEESKDFEDHISKCKACHEKLKKKQIFNDLLLEDNQEIESDFDVDRAWKKFDSKMDWGPSYWERKLKNLFKPKIWIPATCTAAIAAFIFTISPTPPDTTPIATSSVVEVSSSGGSTMVLRTAQSGTPLIMFFPDADKEAG